MISNTRFGLGYRLQFERHPDSISIRDWTKEQEDSFLTELVGFRLSEAAGTYDQFLSFHTEGKAYVLDNETQTPTTPTIQDYKTVKANEWKKVNGDNVLLEPAVQHAVLNTARRHAAQLIEKDPGTITLTIPYKIIPNPLPGDPDNWGMQVDYPISLMARAQQFNSRKED